MTPAEHVKDTHLIHISDTWFGGLHIHLPNIFGLQITKYMVLELLAAGLVIAIFVPLARRANTGSPPRGPWWNAFESLLTFVRNEIAKPNLGEHHADRFVPFLWTMFLFILFCNLLGMIPFLGSPTANIWVTGGLALIAFIVLHGAPIAEHGFVHYLKSLWPHIELGHNIVAVVISFFLSFMIWAIELAGTVIKCGVLAVRLFANMFAGHMVLASILMFIAMAGNAGYSHLWLGISLSSVLGVVALSLLELFVAFLQAYVFVFLMALFMGMALHPEH
jgi:F-type H+-transporting ATPase subunit a